MFTLTPTTISSISLGLGTFEAHKFAKPLQTSDFYKQSTVFTLVLNMKYFQNPVLKSE